MRAVRRSDTAPEMAVRRLLHRAGYRYRLHDVRLPGRPDVVFRRRRKVIFVHGCFWHGHECRKGRLPKSRVDYWQARIERNRLRDARAMAALEADGWRCLVVWECETRDGEETAGRLAAFLD
jgi:DNA mismatch endonuclease (patch repair protein)